MLKRILPVLLLTLLPLTSILPPGHAASTVVGVNLDASSSSQTDITIDSSRSNAGSFRVGAVVNATEYTPLSGVYGWQFTINYNRSMFVPEGDPNPLSTQGNSLGLYPDGASNTVLLGAQTTVGTVNWAGLVGANHAFESFNVNSTSGQVSIFFVMLTPGPPVNIATPTLLANVNFEILTKTTTAQIFSISSVIFVDSSDSPILGVVAGASASETVANDPPHASFTYTAAKKIGPYAYTLNGRASSDTDDKIPNPSGYFWDLGDGTQDLGLSGPVVVHNYTAAGPFNVTLRVQDSPGATGSARDSLGSVVLNGQPSHTKLMIGQLGSAPTTPGPLTSDGCLSQPQALEFAASSTGFKLMDSAANYHYENYATATDGFACRTVLFFQAGSGDTIEATVNSDGSIANMIHSSPSSSKASANFQTPDRAGLRVCPNGGNVCSKGAGIQAPPWGANMSFTIPTVYSPTSVGINNNGIATNCCLMAEWVGLSAANESRQSSADRFLVQAGIFKGTDHFASSNNVLFYQIWSGTKKIFSQELHGPPCSEGNITDGDTLNVQVAYSLYNQPVDQSNFNFTFQDMIRNNTLCKITVSTVSVPGKWDLTTADFVVEAPKDDVCSFISQGVQIQECELPAWEPAIQVNGWVFVAQSGQIPINSYSNNNVENDTMNGCFDLNPSFKGNVIPSPFIGGNTWNLSWRTSAQQYWNNCGANFDLAPYPNPLVFASGSSLPSSVGVNSVNGYNNNLTFTSSTSPSSGLTVSCPQDPVVRDSVGGEVCTFSSSNPGIYIVTITATDGSLTHSTIMTVIVGNNSFTSTPSDSADGVRVTVSVTLYVNGGRSIGSSSLTSLSISSGVTLYSRTRLLNFTGTRVVEEVYNIPFWLSVNCDGQDCRLTRTLDINHDGFINIVDLATVAGSFGRTCPTGCPMPLQQQYVFTMFCSPQCATSPDLAGPNGYPDGFVNIFDLTAVALFFFGGSSPVPNDYPVYLP